MGDFALIWDSLLGSADLAVVDDDLASDEGLRTAVLLSLYIDARADEGDELPGDDGDLRGSWSDEFLPDEGDRQGSKLWLLDRAKVTPGIQARAEGYIHDALAWMIEDRVLAEIEVESEIGSDHLYKSILLRRPDGREFRFEHAWIGEAAKWDGYALPPIVLPNSFAGSIDADAAASGAFTQTGFPFAGAIDGGPTLSGGFELDAGIDHTLDGIAGAADPLQALADACGMAFKFDYLWIVNQASGDTIELSGSGLDLATTGATLAQADARLGAGNTVLFDADAEKLAIADDAALDIGTGSMAMLAVFSQDTQPAVGVLAGKHASSLGYWARVNTTGSHKFFVRTASGLFETSVSIVHDTADAQVNLMRRITSAQTVNLDTREGSANVSETTVGNADTTSEFSIGQNSGTPSFRGSFGLLAFIKGANAESVTPTHRANLQTWLGFD